MPRSSNGPTIADVAKHAGVSTATVSYVLNNIERTSEEARQRVLQAVSELGYAPNLTARHLRRQSTERVCLVVPYVGLTYYNSLAEELQAQADDLGYSVIISATGTKERERRVFEQLRRGLADAVIIRTYFLEQADLDLLAKSGAKVVAITNFITEPSGFDIVRIDDTTGCNQAMDYLIDRDHHQIAFLGHLADRSMHQGRFECFQQALAQAQIPVNETLIRTDINSREKAYTSTRALIDSEEEFTAILAASDTIAVSAIWAIRDAGFKVPDDIAVVGFGNHPEGAMMTPSLTTVGAINEGYEDVIELLFSRLEASDAIPNLVHLRRWEFIKRDSA